MCFHGDDDAVMYYIQTIIRVHITEEKHIYIYYTTRMISSANIAFVSANIQQCYTVQQLIAVKRSRMNGGKLLDLFLDLFVQLSYN